MNSTVVRSERAEALLLDGEVCALLRIGETTIETLVGRVAPGTGDVAAGHDHAPPHRPAGVRAATSA